MPPVDNDTVFASAGTIVLMLTDFTTLAAVTQASVGSPRTSVQPDLDRTTTRTDSSYEWGPISGQGHWI